MNNFVFEYLGIRSVRWHIYDHIHKDMHNPKSSSKCPYTDVYCAHYIIYRNILISIMKDTLDPEIQFNQSNRAAEILEPDGWVLRQLYSRAG